MSRDYVLGWNGSALKTARLIESEPGDADRRINVVPLSGDVLGPNLKIALLSRGERRIVFCEQTLLVAQHHLVERIVKFERDFNLLDAPVAAVLERPEHKCYFLIQKIGSAAHFRFQKMDLRSVGLFGGAHG